MRKGARSLRRVLIPAAYGYIPRAALDTACALAQDVVLVGLLHIPEAESLSAGARRAGELRRQLRALAGGCIRARSRVRVSHAPWPDLRAVIASEDPDLLMLEWGAHLAALGIAPAELLAEPPCDVALVRGPFPPAPARVLLPVRGGPHAELALRLSLALEPQALVALHMEPGAAGNDAPFRGLARVLQHLPEVETRGVATQDAAAMILEQASAFDLVVMGSTAQAADSPVSLGPVADRVLHEAPAGVIVVKTRRSMRVVAPDETAGAQAISVLVDKWFAENTFHADEFADLERLVALKRAQGVTISLALPALNEEETVGNVIETVRHALVDEVPLLDEVVLIDSNSSDRTRDIAASLDIPVFVHQQLLPDLGPRQGKGEALWKSLLVTRGDLLAWIDTDIVNIHPRFIYGILGPLLLSPRIQFVKGFYRRPLRVGEKLQAGNGGRVTELTARPLLNLFYPELSGVVQPLSGEYAGRRTVLERLPFFSGYGVETGLLIDAFETCGLGAIAQVDLLERVHHNQPLEALSKMSFAILQAVIRKLERRYGQAIVADVHKSMKLIRYEAGSYWLDVEEIVERERPPMLDVPAYRERLGVSG